MTWKDAFKFGVMIAVGAQVVNLSLWILGIIFAIVKSLLITPGVGA